MTLIILWAVVATLGWLITYTANHTLARRLEVVDMENDALLKMLTKSYEEAQ